METNVKQGISWERHFSPSPDPYDTIPFEIDDIVLRNNKTGEAFWTDLGVTFPAFWDRNAREITDQHYLRGNTNAADREKSIPQMINRVVDTIVRWAQEGRPEIGRLLNGGPLFADASSAAAFAADLKFLIITQVVNFNSPVWYNIGVEGVAQQPSACFILEVQDTMDAILGWYTEEGNIFKGGSGSGTNLGQIRSSYEGLSRGGWASGPVSYMCGADASAGTMKSGGRSRRAAKMVVLPIDHPDILEQANGAPGFVGVKARAERVNKALAAAGFDVSVDSGIDSIHVQFQNANNSVRVSLEFMETLLADGQWQTVARSEVIKKELPKYQAKKLWRAIAQAAWECADPGLQFDTTVNHWNTTPAAGRINASNPCSEYMHLDNSPCNLAATNLLKFLNEDGSWKVDDYRRAVSVVAIAQTIMAAFGDYPTPRIEEVATGFRQIGHGYTNLGAMLMTNGLAYDSADGRAWNAAVGALMQAELFVTSAKIAAVWGAYPGTADLPGFDNSQNREAHLRVAEMHQQYCQAIAKPPTARGRKFSLKSGDQSHIDIFHENVVGAGEPLKRDPHLKALQQAALTVWAQAIELGKQFGFANAHLSVLAPMGTNGYMMGNDTTGIEPALSLKISKKKVDGSWMSIVNQSIHPALRKLGYTTAEIEEIEAYVAVNNSLVGAPGVNTEHLAVFDTSFAEPVGNRYLSPEAHLLQMAAVQPFLSGAISKTVNMPEEVTVDEVEQVYLESWRLGLKSVALYRDNCKATQPMSAVKKDEQFLAGPPPAVRHKLPRIASGNRIKLRIVDSDLGEFEMYVLCGLYPDGSLGEIFGVAGAEGSLVNGLLGFAAKQMSTALQHGVPVRDIVNMGLNMKFDPSASMISPVDSEFTSCTSIVDLLCRELGLLFLSTAERHNLGIFTRAERALDVATNYIQTAVQLDLTTPTPDALAAAPRPLQLPFRLTNAPICFNCSTPMRPNGACYSCPNCGNTTGCS